MIVSTTVLHDRKIESTKGDNIYISFSLKCNQSNKVTYTKHTIFLKVRQSLKPTVKLTKWFKDLSESSL